MRVPRPEDMPLVIIESPYSARRIPDYSWDAEAVEENLRYLRAAMKDCLLRGEAPYASHGLYTQPGVLDDQKMDERKLGMAAGFAWNRAAAKSVVYYDRGFSQGMLDGIDDAVRARRALEFRSLRGWEPKDPEKMGDIYRSMAGIFSRYGIGPVLTATERAVLDAEDIE